MLNGYGFKYFRRFNITVFHQKRLKFVFVRLLWNFSVVECYYILLVDFSLHLLNSSKNRDPASTPPAQRNGTGGSGQLSVGTPVAGSTGPSPHMARRGQWTYLKSL